MLQLDSGFELDYNNIYNESCIQARDIQNFERAIQNVWRHTNILRSTGYEEGHLLKMVSQNQSCFISCHIYQKMVSIHRT